MSEEDDILAECFASFVEYALTDPTLLAKFNGDTGFDLNLCDPANHRTFRAAQIAWVKWIGYPPKRREPEPAIVATTGPELVEKVFRDAMQPVTLKEAVERTGMDYYRVAWLINDFWKKGKLSRDEREATRERRRHFAYSWID